MRSSNLDALAAEGILYENAHTPSPECMPARCRLMTGVHTHVHGCIENGFACYNHLPMLTELLQEAGCEDIIVGKAHVVARMKQVSGLDAKESLNHISQEVDAS